MGVTYSTCPSCEEAYYDGSRNVTYCNCGIDWCCEECAENDGRRIDGFKEGKEQEFRVDNEHEEDEEINFEDVDDKDYYLNVSCNYCRKEDYDDYTLLNHALSKLEMSREELVQDYNLTQRK